MNAFDEPWIVHGPNKGGFCWIGFGDGQEVAAGLAEDVARDVVLSHNADLVMKRRGWTLYRDGGGWWVACETGALDGCYHGPVIKDSDGNTCWYTGLRPDPRTALVDADEWYKENVEGK